MVSLDDYGLKRYFLRVAWDRMRVYENHIKCIKSYKSVQDYLNSNLHSRNTFFWLKSG